MNRNDISEKIITAEVSQGITRKSVRGDRVNVVLSGKFLPYKQYY